MNSKDWKQERKLAYDILAIAVQHDQRVRVEHAIKRIKKADRMIKQSDRPLADPYKYQTKHKRVNRKGS